MNPRELLAVVEATWRDLDAAIEGLDAAALVEPGVVETWSVKDLLGHVVAWEQMALRHLDEVRRGAGLTPSGGAEVDRYNVAESERRRDWTVDQVRAEMVETRQRLRVTLEHMDDATWAAPVQAGEWRATVGELIGGNLGGDGPGTHAAEHAAHIRAWRARRSGDTGRAHLA